MQTKTLKSQKVEEIPNYKLLRKSLHSFDNHLQDKKIVAYHLSKKFKKILFLTINETKQSHLMQLTYPNLDLIKKIEVDISKFIK